MASRVELESENKSLNSGLTYFITIEIICVVVILFVLYYLFSKRNGNKQKVASGKMAEKASTCGGFPGFGLGKCSCGACNSCTCGMGNKCSCGAYNSCTCGYGTGLRTSQGCNKRSLRCIDDRNPAQAYINAGQHDIYRRHNSVASACATAPSHGFHYAPGNGPVCNAEARLYKILHGNY